jgi:hypothetical protein
MGGIEWPYQALIGEANLPYPLIVGMNFIDDFNVLIDAPNRCIFLDHPDEETLESRSVKWMAKTVTVHRNRIRRPLAGKTPPAVPVQKGSFMQDIIPGTEMTVLLDVLRACAEGTKGDVSRFPECPVKVGKVRQDAWKPLRTD